MFFLVAWACWRWRQASWALRRQLIWAEIDSNPASPANVELVIHPGTSLDENTRYIVALRKMRDSGGHLLAPSAAFGLFRDRRLSTATPSASGCDAIVLSIMRNHAHGPSNSSN